ncbi:Uncharacterized protein BM_BM17164 [Brugia malayi]|uniref:C2H2-type domain-containing protein n=1 Tax=Brugia malayi TaxID=6279 RepID=A0A4E9FS74_BRUMA|nr:Uncharacterized protein BM_BM17164 [Brugia malayi]VIP00196.1 Uncharacterized protein BM_BM17164 [Brugia malayi]
MGIAAPMEDQEIEVLFEYLKREPEMYRILQRFVSRTVQFEQLLIGKMAEAGWRLEELVGQSAQPAMEEDPVPQEPEFNEEEAEWAPLPENENGDEAENWPSEAEWTPLPEEEEEEEEPEVPGVPMEIEEPVGAVRELVLRTRTIRIPVPAMQEAMAAAPPEKFEPADLKNLPEQLRRELIVPQAEPYTVAQGEGSKNIVCGLCCRQFETLKGWRIHASRTHKQDGFCARCGHYLLLPPEFTAAQRTAAMELHALDWCPRACAAVISERQVKRRRLDLANIIAWSSSCGHLSLPAANLHPLPMKAG